LIESILILRKIVACFDFNQLFRFMGFTPVFMFYCF